MRLDVTVTEADYQALLVKQGGACALCGRSYPKRRLSIDHDHETGRIRGLLCVTCNSAIAALGDDRAGLERALAYLVG